MLDVGKLDLDEIATALSDQTDHEHRWLIDPRTGEIAFWTSDAGIDGENPVDLDELDLMPIDPLPSAVWYADMADFAEGVSDDAAGGGWGGLSEAGEPFVGSKTSCSRSTRIWCRGGTPSETLGQSVEQSNGYSAKGSSRTMPPASSWSTTRIPTCLDDTDSRLACTCAHLSRCFAKASF